jgi:hypothetical protein
VSGGEGQPEGPPLGLAVMRRLQQRTSALEHENQHLRELVQTLRRLVGTAFEEGFRARVPDSDEPWLVDWLQSQSKARLGELFERPGAVHDHAEEGG